MDGDGLANKLKQLHVDKKKDINVLLLGETGVGKSTFINAFCNYLQYSTLQNAMNGEAITLIPVNFTLMDDNYESKTVHVGADANEFTEVGVSATQTTKSYVFPIKKGKLRIRLIDTPGIGDTRGIEQDNINFENLLSFIGELRHLNAICILLKPNNARLTVMFEFCIKQLLSRLDKSASKNLVFIFTNCRNTMYRPGETLPALQKLLKGASDVNIPLSKNNIFCTDNEAFRFLLAANNGIKFSKKDVDDFSHSWRKSAGECQRMITYISGDASSSPLEPHIVKHTISINEARRVIIQLSQPLAEIAQLIQDNITALKRHEISLTSSNQSLADLKKKLYVPVINLKIIELTQPTTVCTTLKCTETYQVGDRSKCHYRQKCHSPCYLTNIPKEIIGTPELAHCAAMKGRGVCNKCNCPFQVHMHIYFETVVFEDKIEDQIVKNRIFDKRDALKQLANVIADIHSRLKEYEQERETILHTTAKFAYFLQTHAITPYNDAHENYLLYLIDREESLGQYANRNVILEHQQMLQRYKEEKNALKEAQSQCFDGTELITADDILNSVESLYNLKCSGDKIREMIDAQQKNRKLEVKSECREYVHKSSKQRRRQTKTNREKETNYKGNNRPVTYYKNNFQPQRQMNRPPNPNSYVAGTPLQYFQLKQDQFGQFDLRFAQRDQNYRTGNQYRQFQPGFSQYQHQWRNNSNFGHRQNTGAIPRTYNARFDSPTRYNNQNFRPGLTFPCGQKQQPVEQQQFLNKGPPVAKNFEKKCCSSENLYKPKREHYVANVSSESSSDFSSSSSDDESYQTSSSRRN